MKNSIAKILHASGIDRRYGASNSHYPLIIAYHRVVENFQESSRSSIPSMLVSSGTFRAHLEWIGTRYDYGTLDEVLLELERMHRGEKPRKRPLAAITFDDGYVDVLQNAVPIMNSLGVPSTMFVVTDLIGSTSFQMHDELYLLASGFLHKSEQQRISAGEALLFKLGLDQPRAESMRKVWRDGNAYAFTRAILEILDDSEQLAALHWLRENIVVTCDTRDAFRALSWSELATMQERDVTIGSHTRSHALLPGVSPQLMQEEVTLSRQELERRLGSRVHHFAYPDGRFCRKSIKAVSDAGYTGAYTICNHRDLSNPHLTISRKVFWERTCSDRHGNFSPQILSCQVNGIFDPARLCAHEHGAL